jgi:UDP-glucose 4-epimerase
VTEGGNLKVVRGSILNRELVRENLQGVDYCFHYAAAVGVEKILQDPINSMKINIHGSENVLEIACDLGVPVILASTSEIYGKNPSPELSEDSDRVIGSPLLWRWSYSDAKAIDEALAAVLFKTRNFQVKIIRYFNTVGPRQSAFYGMVIPSFFAAALSGLPLKIHGDGSQRRVFCHIKDAIEGTLKLWDSQLGFGDVFNVGGLEEISIMDLARKIVALTDSKSDIQMIPYSELRKYGYEDMPRRVPKVSKIRELTGWAPSQGLDKILTDYLMHVRSAD